MNEISLKMSLELLLPVVLIIWPSEGVRFVLYILQKRVRNLKYWRKGTWQENVEGKDLRQYCRDGERFITGGCIL